MKIMQKILLTLIAVGTSFAIQASAPAQAKEIQTTANQPAPLMFSITEAFDFISNELEKATDDNELVKKYRLLSAIEIKEEAEKSDSIYKRISQKKFEDIQILILKKLDEELQSGNVKARLIDELLPATAAPALLEQINQYLLEYFDSYSGASFPGMELKKSHDTKVILEAKIKELIDLVPRDQIIHGKDGNGNSVLQNAMKYNCLPAIQYLVEIKRIPMTDLTDESNQKALRSSGPEIHAYFKQKEDAIDAYLKKKKEELDQKNEPSKEQLKQANDFLKKKQQEKAIGKLKQFAQNNKAKTALEAKARAHVQAHVEKPALKKAFDAMHTYAQSAKEAKRDAEDEKIASKLFDIGTQKKSFNKWKSTALLQKNQKKQEQIYMDRAEKFHKKRMLETAFSGLKNATEQAKKYESELQHKELIHVLEKKHLQAKKTLATWKEKTTAQTHQKKEIARANKELQADLDQYYYHCDELDLQPDRSAIIELEKLVKHVAKTVSLDEKFNYYVANREPILSKMYTDLKNDAAKIEEYRQAKAKKDRQDLEQLMDKEYHQDVQNFQQKCAELNIRYQPLFLAELKRLADLTKQAFSRPEDKVSNYRAMRAMYLEQAYERLNNKLRRDYKFFREMCIQLRTILSPQQILNTSFTESAYAKIKRIVHNIRLHYERAANENLAQYIQAKTNAEYEASLPRINDNTIVESQNIQTQQNALTQAAQSAPATGNGKDEKHSAESRTNTAITASKMANEYDSDEYEYEQVCKSAAHKIGALKLDQFIQKRKARKVLQYWNLEFDNGRCTEREKAILKKDGALKLKRFFERKEQRELRKAWQKLSSLKTDKAAQAPSQLTPSVAAFFAAWDNQQAARVVCAKEAQEAHIVHTPVPAGKEENEKLMLSSLKKTEIIKGTPYEFEIVPYEQGQTELHTAILTNDIARVEELLNSGAQMSTRYTKQITSPKTGKSVERAISTSDVIRSPEMAKYIAQTMRVKIRTEVQKKMLEMTGNNPTDLRHAVLRKWPCIAAKK